MNYIFRKKKKKAALCYTFIFITLRKDVTFMATPEQKDVFVLLSAFELHLKDNTTIKSLGGIFSLQGNRIRFHTTL